MITATHPHAKPDAFLDAQCDAEDAILGAALVDPSCSVELAAIVSPSDFRRPIERYHGGGVNLRTRLGRILERAGMVPWPKLFHNLRSSRRTELQEKFPSHVIDAWLGHSTKVAEEHYLQVTDERWARAADSGSPTGPPTGPPIADDSEPSGPITKTKKPWKNQGSDGTGWVQTDSVVTPMGSEQSASSQGIIQGRASVPLPVPSSLPITAELAELLRLWECLDETGREWLLANARRLANRDGRPT